MVISKNPQLKILTTPLTSATLETYHGYNSEENTLTTHITFDLEDFLTTGGDFEAFLDYVADAVIDVKSTLELQDIYWTPVAVENGSIILSVEGVVANWNEE